MGYATEEQSKQIIELLKVRDAERQALMPDYRAALDQASNAKERLGKLGWREGIYCPKDGTEFALIEWGSTGVHLGFYVGDWPKGHIYCCDFGMRPEAVMFKEMDALTDDEKTALEASIEDTKEFIERQARAMGAITE